jgi:hypothetical protein
MTKEFVPYELAVKLKELGFDEPCFGYYHNLGSKQLLLSSKDLREDNNDSIEYFPSPTFSQVFRFFRDKHNIDAWVQPFVMTKSNCAMYLPDESYSYFIFKDGKYAGGEVDFIKFEEAEISCLNKVIEIVKKKNL